MRSVRMPAAFLPCSDGSPEWIPHGGPLLQRLTVTCTHLVPDLAGTKCSKRARRTCKAQHHSWQSVDIVENESNQDILIRKMQGAYIHHLSRGPRAQSCCTRAETRGRLSNVGISAAKWF